MRVRAFITNSHCQLLQSELSFPQLSPNLYRGEASHKLSKNAGDTTNKRHETLTNQLSTKYRANAVYNRLTKLQDVADDSSSSDGSDYGENNDVGDQPKVGSMKYWP